MSRTPNTRRFAMSTAIRRAHGAAWRDVARRQVDVARKAAADFEAAGDAGMADMLRGHADILVKLAAQPIVRRKRPAPAAESAEATA